MILITLVALSPFQHRKNLRVYDCCNSSFWQSLDLFGQVAKMQRRAATTRYPRIILISRYLVCPSHSHTHFGAANGTARGPFCAIPDNLVGSPARVEFGPQIREFDHFFGSTKPSKFFAKNGSVMAVGLNRGPFFVRTYMKFSSNVNGQIKKNKK